MNSGLADSKAPVPHWSDRSRKGVLQEGPSVLTLSYVSNITACVFVFLDMLVLAGFKTK